MTHSRQRELAIVILAGGHSSRFGSDKAQALIEGRRSIDRVVSSALGVTSLVAVVGGEGSLPVGVNLRIPDFVPGGGPVQAILGAFRALPGSDLLVVACDLPVVTTQHLAFLARGLPVGIEARVPRGSEYPMPLSALYGWECAATFERCWVDGLRSMREVLEHLHVEWVGFDALRAGGMDPNLLDDFDTPKDLARILKMAGKRED